MPPPTRPRRFRRPWKALEEAECFLVSDAGDQPIAYVYFEDSKRADYFNRARLTKDEARRISGAIARLPELLTLEKQLRDPAGGTDDA